MLLSTYLSVHCKVLVKTSPVEVVFCCPFCVKQIAGLKTELCGHECVMSCQVSSCTSVVVLVADRVPDLPRLHRRGGGHVCRAGGGVPGTAASGPAAGTQLRSGRELHPGLSRLSCHASLCPDPAE